MRVHHADNPDDATTVGIAARVERTSGRLTAGERRGLLGPLARTHLRNTDGRVRLATGLHPGRTAYVPPARLVPPDTVLTRSARDRVQGRLPVPLLNHSHRAYLFGRALGELEGLEVDSELLFAAALLHDTGLVAPPARWRTYWRQALLSTSSGSAPGSCPRQCSPTRPRSTLGQGSSASSPTRSARRPGACPTAASMHRYGAFAAAVKLAPYDE